MIFNRRSLATAATALVVALSSLSSANAEEWWHDECSSLKLEARTMLETSPSCALVKSLLNGDAILDGTNADVEGVCVAKPSCVDKLGSMVSSIRRKRCSMTSDEARVVQQIEDYSNDVTILTNYFCNNNCYEVSQRIWSGDYSAATCPCLLDYNSELIKLSKHARNYLGLTSRIDRQINQGIRDMRCRGENLRSSATQLEIE